MPIFKLPEVRTQVVPAYPEPYIRQSIKKKKRGRPKKNGRPKKDRYYMVRSSPTKRAGARFHSISVSEEAYFMLKELAAFYKHPGMGAYLITLVQPAFERAYEESLTLQRIHKNRKKANDVEVQDGDESPPRTHF